MIGIEKSSGFVSANIKVLRPGHARTDCIVNDPVAPAVTAVTNDVVAYPVVFIKIHVDTTAVNA